MSPEFRSYLMQIFQSYLQRQYKINKIKQAVLRHFKPTPVSHKKRIATWMVYITVCEDLRLSTGNPMKEKIKMIVEDLGCPAVTVKGHGYFANLTFRQPGELKTIAKNLQVTEKDLKNIWKR